MISDYFSCLIAFLNPVQKSSGVWVFTRSLENSSVTLFRAQIISLRLPYLLFSLLICQTIDYPHLHSSHLIIRARFGSVLYPTSFPGLFCIGLQRLHVKQNGSHCNGSIFVPPTDTEQSRTGLLEKNVSDSRRAI